MFRLFKKAWILLLLVVVVMVGTYAVVRIRDLFGAEATAAAADGNGDETKPFNPKHITYEITGPPGGSVNVDYLDADGQPHRVDAAPLPWAYTVVTTLPSMSANAEFAHVEVGRGHTPRVSLPRRKESWTVDPILAENGRVSLKNARVVVIGGTSGIGLGVASAAAERGAIPIVVSRQQSSVDHALSQLPERARGATVDLTDLTGLERLAADIGDIEHLVFTAGESLELAPLSDLTPEVITRFFQTRFVGALTAVRVFGSRITSGGSITLTSGTAAEQPGFGALPVSICGAMNALTKALAFELAPIRVNAVAPGVVRTPLWDAMGEADRQAMYDQAAQQIPLGRVGEVGDTARAYLYCMEQEFGTGVVLTVDGGTTLV